jgi:hypothetical protein
MPTYFKSNTNLYYSKYSAAGLVLLQIHHQPVYKNPKTKYMKIKILSC